MNKYAEHIAEVARDLWGDENKRMSHGSELRFGSHGSKSVDTEKGTWFDHETQESGGFTDLCKIAYPEANGHLADFLQQKFHIEKDPAFASQKRDQITAYDYIGDHGVLEYQVIRIDYADGSKTFRQQRPDGKGGWIKNLKDVRKIPYNLPEILHQSKRAVWIVEGEKCVDRLRELGIVATTNNGGSGNWTEEHSQWLKGRKVVIVPDNDEAGQKHAAKVINSLIGVAEDIKLLDLSSELPNKGDIVDWLDTGKTKESLVAKARAAKTITEAVEDPGEIEQEVVKTFDVLQLHELMSMPPIKWLTDTLLTRHGFAVMYGPPGCGKTFVALDMALSVASGRDFHEMGTVQGAVLYIAGEGVGGLGKRVKAWINNRGAGCVERELPFYVLPTAVNLANPIDLETLLATVDALEERAGMKFSLVVVDTVARALLGADENSATDMGKFVKACDTIKEHTAAAVLGIHHSGKDSGKGMRGSSALLGAVDTSIKVKKSEGVVTLETEKQKDAEPADDIQFEMVTADVGTIAEETSVFLKKLSAAEIASKGATLNEVQMKAMNCLRDATESSGNINLVVARDSFNFWLAEKEELDLTDAKAKARARMAWKRAIDALIDANIVLFAPGGKTASWKQETNSSEQETNRGEQDESL
jgi:5S rRNA maturation endonuclease (ribonuclease M5)/RecA/RadA recombinase